MTGNGGHWTTQTSGITSWKFIPMKKLKNTVINVPFSESQKVNGKSMGNMYEVIEYRSPIHPITQG